MDKPKTAMDEWKITQSLTQIKWNCTYCRMVNNLEKGAFDFLDEVHCICSRCGKAFLVKE